MKETPTSTLEKAFIGEALNDSKRVDGRHLMERRGVEIHFGSDYGSCIATLGQTRVAAQVSSMIMEPRPTRPNEGVIVIYVEFPAMCSQRFTNKSYGTVEEEITEVTRLVERCLKESRCVDTESLCIVSEEKVWCIRLDLRVLNHEGNVADCASIAGLSALAHYRRPDVTLDGDIVRVHAVSERDPVKLAIHHYPVCCTFAFFTRPETSDRSDRVVVADPSHTEESVMAGKLVIGMNPYREICTLHLAGKMLIDQAVVMRLTNSASDFAKTSVDMIKNALKRDEDARSKGEDVGLLQSMKRESILANERHPEVIDIDKLTENTQPPIEDEAMDADNNPTNVMEVHEKKDGVVELVDLEDKEEEDEQPQIKRSKKDSSQEESAEAEVVEEVSAEQKRRNKVLAEVDLESGSDSEEEAVGNVGKEEIRGWYKDRW